jgi:hypothetical protein
MGNYPAQVRVKLKKLVLLGKLLSFLLKEFDVSYIFAASDGR